MTKRKVCSGMCVTKRTNVAGSNLLVLQDDMNRKSGDPEKRPFFGVTRLTFSKGDIFVMLTG